MVVLTGAVGAVSVENKMTGAESDVEGHFSVPVILLFARRARQAPRGGFVAVRQRPPVTGGGGGAGMFSERLPVSP